MISCRLAAIFALAVFLGLVPAGALPHKWK
jgi:hypothetical protein